MLPTEPCTHQSGILDASVGVESYWSVQSIEEQDNARLSSRTVHDNISSQVLQVKQVPSDRMQCPMQA